MTVKLNLKPLDNLRDEIHQSLTVPHRAGPVKTALNQWSKIVRGHLQERFERLSRGGGAWRGLSKATLAARRNTGRRRGKGGARRRNIRSVRFRTGASVSLNAAPRILRDRGLVFRALNPTFTGVPGAIEREIPFGVRIGFGGPAKHDGSKATIAQIAEWHQEGAGRLPVRRIIVTPAGHIIEQMRQVMQRQLDKLR